MRDRLILIAVTFALISSVPATAQTPDGLTPAVETVCDDLIGYTPGLYGLCVAYCEAHDAQLLSPSGDPAELDRPNRQILRNYNSLRSDSDPTMPCVPADEPQDSCPCWTADELLEVLPPISNIDVNLAHAYRNSNISAVLENLEIVNDDTGNPVPPLIQLSVVYVPGESNCEVVNMDYPGGPQTDDIRFDTSKEEFQSQSCRTLLVDRALARMPVGLAWDCFDP
jgi:hypothetical protein